MSAAAETASIRLHHAAGVVDGVACVLEGFVQHADTEVSRQMFALADLLDRVSTDLSTLADEASREEAKVRRLCEIAAGE